MKQLGHFCEECRCASCEYLSSCGTMEGNTEWYCDNECHGEDGAMDECSEYKQEDEKNMR